MGQHYQELADGQEVDRFEVRDLRVKTRFAVDNAFYDEFTPMFGATLSMVYIALVRHADMSQKTWPSQPRIAKQLGLTREWVGQLLMILRIFKIIHKVRVGKGCTDRYYLIDEKQWRRDFDRLKIELEAAKKEYKKGVMRTQFSSPILRTGISRRAVCSSLTMLDEFTSNSKDKQGRINNKDKKTVVRKVSSAPPPTPSKPNRPEPSGRELTGAELIKKREQIRKMLRLGSSD